MSYVLKPIRVWLPMVLLLLTLGLGVVAPPCEGYGAREGPLLHD